MGVVEATSHPKCELVCTPRLLVAILENLVNAGYSQKFKGTAVVNLLTFAYCSLSGPKTAQ